MIGIVVVSHNNIAKAMVSAVQKIIPEFTNVLSIEIESDSPPDASRSRIKKAIEGVEKGGGVILLSDMFGGTPSNLCLSFLEKGKVEIISGFNLPMLIKLASMSGKMELSDLARFIKQYGQKNIVIASEVLEGKAGYG